MSTKAQGVSWQSLDTASGIGGVHAVAGSAEFGRDHQAWCATWLALPLGIPSPDRVRRLRDPQPREARCARGVASRAALGPATGVAVDGQTLRRAPDRSVDLPALPRVSA